MDNLIYDLLNNSNIETDEIFYNLINNTFECINKNYINNELDQLSKSYSILCEHAELLGLNNNIKLQKAYKLGILRTIIDLNEIKNKNIKNLTIFKKLDKDKNNRIMVCMIFNSYCIFRKDLIKESKLKLNLSTNKIESILKILEENNIISSRIINRNKEYYVTNFGIKYIKAVDNK